MSLCPGFAFSIVPNDAVDVHAVSAPCSCCFTTMSMLFHHHNHAVSRVRSCFSTATRRRRAVFPNASAVREYFWNISAALLCTECQNGDKYDLFSNMSPLLLTWPLSTYQHSVFQPLISAKWVTCLLSGLHVYDAGLKTFHLAKQILSPFFYDRFCIGIGLSFGTYHPSVFIQYKIFTHLK